MNKKLQDLVWSVLPKEFKKEVKYKYNKTKTKKIKKECDLGFLNAHEGMFGAHNLISDAEGDAKDRAKEPKPAEPKEDKHFDSILKDGFRDHNRLHIAAMAMQGILANSHQQIVDMKIDKVAELAIAAADKLIAECEKGGK